MTIELIRHGRTLLTSQHRYEGVTDAPLSSEGAGAICRADYVPDLLCVTRLIRTRQTAELLFPGVEQTVVPGLEEMNFGAFEELNYLELEHDRQYREWIDGMCEGRCPGGESRAEFCRRVNEAFAELVTSSLKRNIGSVAIVAHGGTIMSLMERYCTRRCGYFDWHTDCGRGFLLSLCGAGQSIALELLAETDHTVN